MNATEVIDMLEDSFLEAREMGLESISLDSLKGILERARETAKHTPAELARYEAGLERYRHILAGRNSRWSNRLAVMREMVGHTMNTGASALKSATLINGGAAVAVLAFAGQAQSSKSEMNIMASLALALGFFALGVFASAVATGATYVSQAAFGREFESWSIKAAKRWRRAAVGSVLISFLLFVAGGFVCVRTFSTIQAPPMKESQQTPAAPIDKPVAPPAKGT